MKVANNFFLLCQEASFGAVNGVVSALNILEIIKIKKNDSNRKVSFVALTKNTLRIEKDDKDDLSFFFSLEVKNKTTGKTKKIFDKEGKELKIGLKFNRKDMDGQTELSMGTVTPIEFKFKEEGLYEFSIFDSKKAKLSSYNIFVKLEE